MGWRSVVIGNPARLALEDKALIITQEDKQARVVLEDISVLVLDHVQITLTMPLLSACAEAQIAVLTVAANHLPNGIFLPYHPHSRALKVMSAQLALRQPTRKRLWQRIVQHKIANQAAVLMRYAKENEGKRLLVLASEVRSADLDNLEAQAAQIYFRALIQPTFGRTQTRFYNAALNYGYAVVRAAIARTLVSFGFLPAFGLFHHSEQNAFNLADDLIEPYRPVVDGEVLGYFPTEPDRDLEPSDKGRLVSILHSDVALSSHTAQDTRCTLLAAIEASVGGFSSIVINAAPIDHLALPRLNIKPSVMNNANIGNE